MVGKGREGVVLGNWFVLFFTRVRTRRRQPLHHQRHVSAAVSAADDTAAAAAAAVGVVEGEHPTEKVERDDLHYCWELQRGRYGAKALQRQPAPHEQEEVASNAEPVVVGYAADAEEMLVRGPGRAGKTCCRRLRGRHRKSCRFGMLR